jgi:hypothetical protein
MSEELSYWSDQVLRNVEDYEHVLSSRDERTNHTGPGATRASSSPRDAEAAGRLLPTSSLDAPAISRLRSWDGCRVGNR